MPATESPVVSRSVFRSDTGERDVLACIANAVGASDGDGYLNRGEDIERPVDENVGLMWRFKSLKK